MNNLLFKNKLKLSIFLVWLFHASAIIGIGLGYNDWFIQKTPLNLSVSLILFLLVYPVNDAKKAFAFIAFMIAGMFAEWLGVNYQLLFGSYYYGENFGPKLDGVPYLIGAYWALLTFITAAITDYTKWHVVAKVITAAVLMVFLDYLMEFNAPTFDFWHFEGGMPHLDNYLTWFFLGLLLQIILRVLKIKGNKLFSLHLYLAQLLFFLFAYFYFLKL
jgi:putative membrane protein